MQNIPGTKNRVAATAVDAGLAAEVGIAVRGATVRVGHARKARAGFVRKVSAARVRADRDREADFKVANGARVAAEDFAAATIAEGFAVDVQKNGANCRRCRRSTLILFRKKRASNRWRDRSN
jgi:hypothetical protein